MGRSMKKCPKCGKMKPTVEFHKDRCQVDGLQHRCIECNRYNHIGRTRYVRDYQYKRRYGITLEDYEQMIAEQEHKCAICGTDDPGSQAHSNHGTFFVDHDHNTDTVRGLLCNRCNRVLGHVHDDAELLSTMINYLMKWR